MLDIGTNSIQNKGCKAVNEFYNALTYVNRIFYEPNHLSLNAVQEEAQNSDYGAGIFQLNAKSIRFRVAKITPTKIGQFVAFWEKDEDNKNQAFSYEKATDLLVINTFTCTNNFGQFVFPKEPTSKQAIETQKWQLEYFVGTNNIRSDLPIKELLKLYSIN